MTIEFQVGERRSTKSPGGRASMAARLRRLCAVGRARLSRSHLKASEVGHGHAIRSVRVLASDNARVSAGVACVSLGLMAVVIIGENCNRAPDVGAVACAAIWVVAATGWYFVARFARAASAAALIIERNAQIADVPVLCDILTARSPAARRSAKRTLARILPELGRGDSVTLTATQLRVLRTLVLDRDHSLALGAITAVVHTRDVAALPLLDRLANAAGSGNRLSDVRQAACAGAAALREEMASLQAASILVRHCEAPRDSPTELVRVPGQQLRPMSDAQAATQPSGGEPSRTTGTEHAG